MWEGVQIAFVGGGAMGEAMAKAVLGQELVTPDQIIISDILPERLAELEERHGVRTNLNSREAVRDADVVVLSIKPQALSAVLDTLGGGLKSSAVAISIVAGARIGTLVGGLRHAEVVRSMPNTPAQIGQGMTVWIATEETSEQQRQWAAAILEAMGEAIQVDDEKYLDMATAVNGSGPAYVLLFMEAMADAAVYLGFSRPVAEKLVCQTVRGAAMLAEQSAEHVAVLRNKVTSPAGTTAEALYYLEKGALRAVVLEAVRAAYEKSQLLSKAKK